MCAGIALDKDKQAKHVTHARMSCLSLSLIAIELAIEGI